MQGGTLLKAMTRYIFGRKQAPDAAKKAYFEQLSAPVPPAKPFALMD